MGCLARPTLTFMSSVYDMTAGPRVATTKATPESPERQTIMDLLSSVEEHERRKHTGLEAADCASYVVNVTSLIHLRRGEIFRDIGSLLRIQGGDDLPGNGSNARFERQPCHNLFQVFLLSANHLQVGLHVHTISGFMIFAVKCD